MVHKLCKKARTSVGGRKMNNQKLFVRGSELLEKRTQYLQERCKEKKYFEMADVKDWCLEERKNLRPQTDIWTQIILKNADKRGSDVGKKSLTELICLYGMPARMAHMSEKGLSQMRQIQDIITTFQDDFEIRGEARVANTGVVIISRDKKVLHIVGGKNSGSYTTSLLRSDVLVSALSTWENSHSLRNIVQARNFLCTWLERRIQYVLDEEGEEFDGAVAVTEDGTKILSADRVVLSRYNRTLQLCGNLFDECKIIQHSNLIRDNDPVYLGSAVTRENIFPAFMGRFNMCVVDHWQQYFTTVIRPIGVVEKWLWCHIGEDNFPEGGTTFKL